MSNVIKYVLLTDGSSDTVLLPILDWLLGQKSEATPEGQWADLRGLPNPQDQRLSSLALKIYRAVIAYPCDILFIHRDSEKQGRRQRLDEIDQAIEEVERKIALPLYIAVVPVRMQEAWLLIDEIAIRQAVGNPNGRARLDIPRFRDLESLTDPKETLHTLLKTASELGPARLKRFRPEQAVHRIVDYIDDWSPLRTLSAFQALEADIQRLIEEQSWKT